MVNSRLPVFTERFALLRGEMTQAQFADMLGLSRPTVSLYESGKRIPGAAEIKVIAEKCNVSADYLLGLRDDSTSDKDLQFIVDYTGLSTETIEKFHQFAFLRGHESRILEIFDNFIKQFYARFLHKLIVLKQTVELSEEGLSCYLSDNSQGSLNVEYVSLRQRLYEFSEFCRKIPDGLFNTDKLYDEIEKRATYAAVTASEKDIEDFLKSGLE